MLDKKSYFNYYKVRGKCIDQLEEPNQPLNERQLETKYQNYKKKEAKKLSKTFEVDKLWEEVRYKAFVRDRYICRLTSKLAEVDKSLLKENAKGLYKKLDPAHVFSRGAFPHMKYEVDNLVILNRWSHSCLDSGKDPIFGKPLEKEEIDKWWEFIVGEDLYSKLKEKSVKNNH